MDHVHAVLICFHCFCYMLYILLLHGMTSLTIKASHKPVRNYYSALSDFDSLGVKHETAVRSAFQALLNACCADFKYTLVPEFAIKRKGLKPLRIDGALLDTFGLRHGFWEAKDSNDDLDRLDREIKRKLDLGYPSNNTLFQSPKQAVLYQDGRVALCADLTDPRQLVDVLKLFFEYTPPALQDWGEAVKEFEARVPELAEALVSLIRSERQTNKGFIDAFQQFVALCRSSINPELSDEAVEEMLIQHILTERIFRRIFNLADFTQRNVIAVEIEKVVQALTSKHFSRDKFLEKLDRFYVAIERAASTIRDFTEKQEFLNNVYERFFQGFCVQIADTHGIVYTPQPIVDFMVASVNHVLHNEFRSGLSGRNVHVLDGFVGTGNFIVNIMRAIPRSTLTYKYTHELHCNEVMLLPYYIASINIEHEFYEAAGRYQPFEGICLVDTFETARERVGGDVQEGFEFFSKANTKRIRRQRESPIFVCIGNPPYNAGQLDENDNNKNRKYPELDRRVSKTYGEASSATLRRRLSDPYVKAIRFASDRIGDAGIVAFVNNNSFIDERTFDGTRKHLVSDFDLIYILDLGVNVRKNPKLSGTTHNVFGIQVGVSINIFVRLPKCRKDVRCQARILYHAVPVEWRKEQKLEFLDEAESVNGISWRELTPDIRGNWLSSGVDGLFASLLPMATRESRDNPSGNLECIFRTYALGVSTNRDDVAYAFDYGTAKEKGVAFSDAYNSELERWTRKGCPNDIDAFVNYDKLKWSENLKRKLRSGVKADFRPDIIVRALYRPFTGKALCYDPILVDRPSAFRRYFPRGIEDANVMIGITDPGSERPFVALVSNHVTDLHLVSPGCGTQCFPFYTYNEDGTARRENITDAALVRFQQHYNDDVISKWDIFHYVYGVLHHPSYRERFAANLKRELPRIPFAPNFREFVRIGRDLTGLHLNYHAQEEFALEYIENRHVRIDWRVEAMRLDKDRCSLYYNAFLTLEGIPRTTLDYKLGNRSALEWVIDQ
jgi:predicted helicase